jgi:hypothetical protein
MATEYDQQGYVIGEISDPAPSSADTPQAQRPPISNSKASSKYQAHMMKYPLDVMGVSHQNYIMFYINVQSDSKVVRDQSDEISTTQPSRAGMNSLVGKPFSTYTYVAAKAAEGAILGAIAAGSQATGGDGTAKTINTLKSAAKGFAFGGLGAGALAAGATTLVSNNFTKIDFGQPAKRLKEAIVLYTPQQLSVRYGMQWSEEEMDMATAMATNPELANSLKAVENQNRSGGGQSSSAVGGATRATANIVAAEVLKKNAGMSAASRTAGNPRKEQIFKGVDYRRFTFDYQFYPKSPEEAKAALNIIWLFKYHMHPEFKDANNFVYVYPSEFDIEYFINGSPNESLNKISSCVLTEMNVNYSPNGVFSTFPDGTPTQINMTLNFVELETLTKERIEAGL